MQEEEGAIAITKGPMNHKYGWLAQDWVLSHDF